MDWRSIKARLKGLKVQMTVESGFNLDLKSANQQPATDSAKINRLVTCEG